jgi:elongation factor P--(R)-beta-lysine ligase
MPSPVQWEAARARARLEGALRAYFAAQGYLEVHTPLLVPAPGMEPHITPFSTQFIPETGVGVRRPLWLHTSPEYAMKRLLADPGCPPLFQLCPTFRNGEVSATHNPEFTMLEFYRPHADYHAIMADLEGALAAGEAAVAPGKGLFTPPFERLSVRDAVLQRTGLDVLALGDGEALAAAARAAGVHVGDSRAFDDVFFHLFLERVERTLGAARPTYLMEYPASMASLARLKPGDARVAERVELYAKGVELANGFSELTDGAEQRRRLVEEQAWRRAHGREVLPLDEAFLEAVGRMPPSAGIAVGLDRVLMLLLGRQELQDVLLFPAADFVG